MPEQTILTHVAHMNRIAAYCVPLSGDDPQDIATDILADLQHWCRAAHIDFGRSLYLAGLHVAAELEEEAEFTAASSSITGAAASGDADG